MLVFICLKILLRPAIYFWLALILFRVLKVDTSDKLLFIFLKIDLFILECKELFKIVLFYVTAFTFNMEKMAIDQGWHR